jgi:hypothetical protein
MNRKKASTPRGPAQPDYDQFEATELFCPRCRRAVPVRKRLLLLLPDGDEYEYLCAHCSTSLGTKMEFEQREVKLLV